MKVKATQVKREVVEVDVDPINIIRELLKCWIIKTCSKAEYLRLTDNKWVGVDGDYHSDWEEVIREATDKEVELYKAFNLIINEFKGEK